MARKKRAKGSIRTTLHLPPDVAAAADRMEELTGWSQAAALAFVYRAGVDALYRAGNGLPAMRELLDAQTRHQQVILSAQGLADASNRELRAARKSLADAMPQAMPIPGPPQEPKTAAAGGEPAAKPKRGRGRPRKDRGTAAHGPADAPGQTTMAHAPRHPSPGLEC